MERRNLSSKTIKIENKKFHFDLMENHRGKYLRITEKSGGKSSIVIPESGIKEFKQALLEFLQENEMEALS